MRAYRLLPEAVVRPVAWGLPFLELAVTVLQAEIRQLHAWKEVWSTTCSSHPAAPDGTGV